MLRNDRKILKFIDFRYASVRAEKFLYTFKTYAIHGLESELRCLRQCVLASHDMKAYAQCELCFQNHGCSEIRDASENYCQKLRLLFVF